MIIKGKNINLRTVEEIDSSFIFEMRQNKNKTKFLSKISGTVETQRKWISNYKLKEKEKKEFYFVIESKKNEKLGLVRLYDFRDDSFCWGSWLIKENAPKTTAIESALQVYEFAFNKLNFKQSHFDVRKNNARVVSFHKRFGAKIVNENNSDYFFRFEKNEYNKTKIKYKRYL
ncbi:GNAT family N-acetyltransferase [Arcobacter sp. YIC-464]|uniref:GNAT family N-acetyltransferase n=1 Tax=Arcobacter sp. YIC-464 TaxID=3376631 RepID=UPI003C250A4C